MATDAGAWTIQTGTTTATASGFDQKSSFNVGPAKFAVGAYNTAGLGDDGLFASNKAGLLVLGSGGLRNLASGQKISSNATGVFAGAGFAKFAASFTSAKGAFSAGKPGFAGIEFNTGTFSNQKIHYGWIQLVYDGSPYPTSITAIDWAYNTVVGQAITAGQTSSGPSATPEPGTMALSLLAMGAAGVLAWRRSRSAVSAE
jgi:hypothetical protein